MGNGDFGARRPQGDAHLQSGKPGMSGRITMTDYNADWAMRAGYVHPRPHAGFLSREEVIALCGGLDIDGLELMHQYWEDCSPAYVRGLTEDAGLPIVSYIFFVDVALPPAARGAAIDQVYAQLDRIAEMGGALGMIVPAVAKDEWSLAQQRAWLVEGLRVCAERAESVGVTLIAENVDHPPSRPLMGRGADCRAICAQVDSPGFRLIYDCAASLFVDEDLLETLQAMAPHVVHVHVKNSRPLAIGEQRGRYLDADNGRRYTGTDLDGGVIELPPILAELDHLGYDGYMLLEYQGEDDPRAALPRNIAYLRQLLAQQ